MSDTSPLGNEVSGGPRTLTAGLFDHLRERLLAGEWRPGQRLPGEHQLAAEYEVSRATVRTALRQLKSFGFTVTRRGSGTYATATATRVRADLRRLESLSATIAACGQRPGMVYNSRTIRPGTPEEILRLELQPEEEVLATERSLTADDEVVAFSYDAIPRSLLSVPDSGRPRACPDLGRHRTPRVQGSRSRLETPAKGPPLRAFGPGPLPAECETGHALPDFPSRRSLPVLTRARKLKHPPVRTTTNRLTSDGQTHTPGENHADTH